MEYKCLTCSKTFNSSKGDKNRIPKYCSRICYSKRIVSEETKKKQAEKKFGMIPWNKGVHMWENKEHPRGTLGKIGLGKGRKASEEAKKKMREAHLNIKLPDRSGEKHPFWKGGVTSETIKARTSLEYKIWRRAVFERDDYTCIFCKKRGGNLQADHIIPFSVDHLKRFDIANGRTLCIECHFKTDTYGGKMLKYSKKVNDG